MFSFNMHSFVVLYTTTGAFVLPLNCNNMRSFVQYMHEKLYPTVMHNEDTISMTSLKNQN